jgi:uncharacterized protein
MADVAHPAPLRSSSWAPGAIMVLSLALVVVILRTTDPLRVAAVQNFVIVFSSLLIEAIPFILLGAMVSAAIEVFAPARWFERLTRLPRAIQLPAAGLAGLAFPVCECGSVPVARRLAVKGLSPAAAVTFMLSAPVLNPVVLASTFVAYRGRDVMWTMVLGRAGLGLVAAMAGGWVIAEKSGAELLRMREPEAEHNDEPSGGGSFFHHLAGDFFFMGRFLVMGAAVAALLQTFVPQSVIGSVAGTPVVDLLAMMALAVVLSLCSESDAFVAASFVDFGVSAQLAFLVFGPMIDTKLGVLYSATFSRKFFAVIALVTGAVILAGTLWLGVLIG